VHGMGGGVWRGKPGSVKIKLLRSNFWGKKGGIWNLGEKTGGRPLRKEKKNVLE